MNENSPTVSSCTPEHVAEYREKGFTLIRGLYDPSELAPLRAYMEEMAEEGAHYDDWPSRCLYVADPKQVQGPTDNPVVGSLQNPSTVNDLFAKVCDDPKMIKAMAALLGGGVTKYADQTIMKLKRTSGPKDGGCSFYHQDAYYWRNIPPLAGANCWVAMDDVGKDNIALAVMPGTQKGANIQDHETYYDEIGWHSPGAESNSSRFRIPADQVDFSQEVLCPMAPGDALFFTNYTWHRSEPNRSGENRYAYAIAYQLADASQRPAL